MNANLDKIALDLYGKIQTRFPDITFGDENGAVLSKKEDIPHARFFEFEYEENGESLGTITITLDTDDGVVVQVSGDLVNDDDDTTHHGAYQFLRSFRKFAKNRLLNFDIQNIGKSNLDKRDYEFQSKRKEEPTMPATPMMENKMFGTSKISYQDLGEARLIVKHSQPVNTELAAGRTMHIEGIYIENAQGERFRYPFKHLNGARALAEHIKAGGIPYDAIGKHITSLSEELAQLRKFKGYVGRQEQLSEAMSDITSKVMERIDAVKKEVHNLQRPAFYAQFAEAFEDKEEQMIPEEVMSNWVDRLTIRTFNEELKTALPYIFKLIDESDVPVKELSADDLFAEATDTVEKDEKGNVKSWKHEGDWKKSTGKDARGRVTNMSDKARRETEKKTKQPEDAFESFMEAMISEDKNELFSANKDAQNSAIDKLNRIMSQELKGGPEGINAIQSLKGLIDDPTFLNSLRDIDPDLDVRPLVQQHVLETDPEVAVHLHFGGEEAPAPAPEMAAPAPAPEMATPAPEMAAPAPEMAAPAPEAGAILPAAPMAEGKSDTRLAKLKAKFIQAKEAGANLNTKMDFGSRELTLHDAIKECGMSPKDVGFDEGGNGVHEILKSIAGFWNREKRNFTIGGQRAKIKVMKDFKDGQFEGATPEDVKHVLSMIDKMDPSGNEHNQIMRLAGVGHSHDIDEGQASPEVQTQMADLVKQMSKLSASSGLPVDLKFGDQQIDMTDSDPSDQISQAFSKMAQAPGANVQQSHTSTGTIDGKPANYDDVMGKFNNMAKGMKFKMGDQELDFSNPDQMGGKIKDMMGGMMKGINMPQGAQQLPGGAGSFDMGKMRDFIQGQMQHGNK